MIIKVISPILFFLLLASLSFAQSSVSAISDPQVVSTLMSINDAEIESSKLAQTKAQNDRVKGFADSMVTDHAANTDDAKGLINRTGTGIQESTLSTDLRKVAKRSNDDLSKATPANFDQLYIAQQVDMHQRVLAMMRTQLLPNTTNPELRAHLDKTVSSVVHHLAMAKEIQAELRQVR